MADKKEEGGGWLSNMDATTRIITLLVGLAVVAAIATRLERVVALSAQGGQPSVGGFIGYFFSRAGFIETFLHYISHGWFFWGSLLVSLVCGVLGVYFFRQWYNVTKAEREAIEMFEAKLVEEKGGVKNERWSRINNLMSSENPADWRVAIIEADVFLHDLMKSMGYHGDGLGDMLKSVEASDFQTLDLAWEAHKIRNRIAHHGSDFILTNREAKRVIDLYRQVFEEFDAI